MHDSAMLYFDKASIARNFSMKYIHTDGLKADSFDNIADKYSNIAQLYCDSFNYFNVRRFQLGGKP
jgi:hypothetical protein